MQRVLGPLDVERKAQVLLCRYMPDSLLCFTCLLRCIMVRRDSSVDDRRGSDGADDDALMVVMTTMMMMVMLMVLMMMH